jgi:hypothetical protein
VKVAETHDENAKIVVDLEESGKQILEQVNASAPSGRKERNKLKNDIMELTKFKLSLLNSVAAYTMFFYHAPLASVGLMPSLTFIFATQAIAMSTQCFG